MNKQTFVKRIFLKRNAATRALFLCVCLVLTLGLGASLAQSANAGQNPGAAPAKKSQPASPSESAKPSDAEIAAAKAQGKVWVNLDTKIYHKSGRWYGKTKNGQFMTESEAKAAGYKASRSN